MAYDAAGLKLIAPGGAIEQTFPTAGVVCNVYSYATNDTLATVMADGYFDGITGDPLVAGDTIMCVADIDGTPTAQTLLVSVGGSDVTVVPYAAVSGLVTTLDTASEAGPAHGVIKLDDTQTFFLGAPIPGVFVTIIGADSSTCDIIPTSTAVFLDLTGNRKATFDALDECLVLLGISTTQYIVVSNVGGVTLGTT